MQAADGDRPPSAVPGALLKDDIERRLAAIADDSTLFEPKSFAARAKALDYLEFHVPEAEADELTHALEAVDTQLFQRLRNDIARGVHDASAFRQLLKEFVPVDEARRHYDTLDLFINGLLAWRPMPAEAGLPDTEMVRYQQTPSRFIVQLADRKWITAHDAVVDIGSGLGQAAMLMHLLTGAAVKGIEIDPALCDYAARSANELNLPRVDFENIDARQSRYDEGTIFYLYTPFKGRVLSAVMDRLRSESAQRTFRLITYGPITADFARASWLTAVDVNGDDYGVFAAGPAPQICTSR